MFRYLNSITVTLMVGLTSTGAYADDGIVKVCGWFDTYIMGYTPPFCSGGGGSSVPELSVAAGPVAVAVILGIVGIGLERRRRKNQK